MKRVQVFVPEDLLRRARDLSRRAGVSFAAVVRRGLEHVLAQEGGPPTEIVGSLKGAPPDLRERLEEIVYGPDAGTPGRGSRTRRR